MAIDYVLPGIPKWDRPAPTKCELDYAELTTIDLSKFDTEQGKLELVETIRYAPARCLSVACANVSSHALTDVGFWIVTGSGFTEEEIERQFAIGQAFFGLPLEERNSNKCDFANGGYFGYRGVSHSSDLVADSHGRLGNEPSMEPM